MGPLTGSANSSRRWPCGRGRQWGRRVRKCRAWGTARAKDDAWKTKAAGSGRLICRHMDAMMLSMVLSARLPGKRLSTALRWFREFGFDQLLGDSDFAESLAGIGFREVEEFRQL